MIRAFEGSYDHSNSTTTKPWTMQNTPELVSQALVAVPSPRADINCFVKGGVHEGHEGENKLHCYLVSVTERRRVRRSEKSPPTEPSLRSIAEL